jgi:amidase
VDYPIDGARQAAVTAASAVLAAAGHRILPVPPATLAPLVAWAAEVFDRIICVNLARNLDPGAAVEPLTAAAIHRGAGISAVALQQAEALAVQVSYALWQLFERYDALLTPMLATPPPPIGAFPTDHGDVELHFHRMTAVAPYATMANVGGVPALTVPHGADAAGLRLPVQLIAPMAQDSRLLRLARVLQAAAPWSFADPIAGLPEPGRGGGDPPP